MIIKNRDEIATTELRRKALEIAESGIEAVLSGKLMELVVNYNREENVLKITPPGFKRGGVYDLSKARVFVVGGGKAVGLMAEKLEEILGSENIFGGVVISKSKDYKAEKIRILNGTHPIPSQKNIEGVKEMLALKDRYLINENDIVICLISGGGSSLMSYPMEEVSLKDLQKTTELLITSGAEIEEINIVRKHLSKIKGGKLGKFFEPAKTISLIISDVIGDDPSIIASGPTSPDFSIFKDAYNILEKYKLLSEESPCQNFRDRGNFGKDSKPVESAKSTKPECLTLRTSVPKTSVPKTIEEFIKRGIKGEKEETIKSLPNCHNYIIGNNRLALEAMREKAKQMGFSPFIITDKLKGKPELVAQQKAEEILTGQYSQYNVLILGGETSPKLPRDYGRGGRNQHFAGLSVLEMEKYKGEWVLVSLATDGSDFSEEVAGAIVDNNTLNQARSKGIDMRDYLKRYDSYNLFEKIGNSLIITGRTGTNVSDIMVYLLK